MAIIAVMIFIAFMTKVYAATVTLYVSSGGENVPTCGSVASPCKTITYALNKVTGPTILKILAGTYNESLNITKDVTLTGAGAATTIIAGSGATPKPPTIQIMGAKVEMSGLTIKGGAPGLMAIQALLQAQNCVFTGNTNGLDASLNSGVFAQSCTFNGNNGFGANINSNSTAMLRSCTASQNKQHGVQVHQSSSADITSCTINGNARDGISVGLSSSAKLQSNAISGNVINGIRVSLSSSVKLETNTIKGNKQIGLIAHQQSAAILLGGNKITANGSGQLSNAGIGVYNAGHVYFQKGSVKDNIYNNNGHGISVYFNGDLYADDNSATITGNNGDGLNLGHDSGAQLSSGVAINSNVGWGIHGTDTHGDSKYSGSPTVSGNDAGQINCPTY